VRVNIKQSLRAAWLQCRPLLLAMKPQHPVPDMVKERVRRVLVIRQDRMGDVILTSALMQPLKQLFPEAELSYWIREPLLPLFEQCEGFSVVSGRPQGDFDLVIDPLLDYPLRGAKLAASFATPWSLGFDVAGRGRYFTMPVQPPGGDEPFLKSIARLLTTLGFEGEVTAPRLEVTALERGNAREVTGFDGPYVLIHPGAFYPSQRWPEKHMAKMIDMLSRQGLNVAVIGSDSDQAILEDIRRRLHAPEDVCFLCGEPLRMVMALMAEAAVVLCNNSGPLHLATALGVATVSTLGPTNPKIWWPVGEKQSVLVAPGCDHCERAGCRRGCLERIGPEEVVDKMNRLLESR